MRLSELGVTGYPARVLTALIENPGASATQLCKLTSIPDSKIYQALDDLEKKWKLIDVSRGNPSLYRALDTNQIIDSLKKNAEQEYSEKLKILASVKKTIEPLAKKAAAPEELEIAYIVKGRHNVVQRLRSAIEESKKQLLFLTFDKDLLEAVQPAMLEAKARKVKVRSAVTPELIETAEAMGPVKELICKCNLLLSDDSKLVTISNWDSDKCHAIVSDDTVMTTIAREYYDNPKCCS
jgi:HTH-type transcriptional regulator, sugar sensing transcriptional regulator